MPYSTDPFTSPDEHGVPDADPADIAEQSRVVEPDSVIEDYPWVRRDEVITIGGHRFFL